MEASLPLLLCLGFVSLPDMKMKCCHAYIMHTCRKLFIAVVRFNGAYAYIVRLLWVVLLHGCHTKQK